MLFSHAKEHTKRQPTHVLLTRGWHVLQASRRLVLPARGREFMIFITEEMGGAASLRWLVNRFQDLAAFHIGLEKMCTGGRI